MTRSAPPTHDPSTPPFRNQAEPLDLRWVQAALVDDLASAEAVRNLPSRTRESHKPEVDRLLEAIRAIDLTALAGDETPGTIRALCARARDPLEPALVATGSPAGPHPRTASVCIHHHFLPVARTALAGSDIPIAVVSAGFPAGLSPLPQRIGEIEASVAAGADEIDAVINRAHALTGAWEALYREVRSFREAAGTALLKVILATGELGTGTTIARAARVCMQAGADFIKTSTGKEAVNATYPAGLIMLRQIRDYRARTGRVVGFKPAGGIRSAAQALEWMQLVEEELGADGLAPERFRLGASGLLDDIVARLRLLLGQEPVEKETDDGAGPQQY